MVKHVIIGNYGDNSIAVLQWALEHALEDIYFISIDTGWQSQGWETRMLAGQSYAQSQGVQVTHLSAPAKFHALVKDRKEFPTTTFQWCASFLKGITINTWLDQVDPDCGIIALLAKRQQASKLYASLPEFIEQSTYYGGRKVWHPLYQHTLDQQNALIQRAGFQVLGHRSLECEPCIHTTPTEFKFIHKQDHHKLTTLENTVAKRMFPKPYYHKAQTSCAENKEQDGMDILHTEKTISYDERFSMGCGSPWGCGE